MSGSRPLLEDLLALPNADAAVVTSLSLERARPEADRLVYLTKLFPEELHAVAGPGLRSVDELNGRPVYLGAPGTEAAEAAKAYLASRSIAVTPVGGPLTDALAGVREGRVAAAFVLAPKPHAALARIGASEQLRLLPLPYRAGDRAFHPAALGADAYPGLVPAGGRVETVALDAVLVAPRWRESSPRQRELAAFARRLLESLPRLGADGRHPKWREVNPATDFAGWRRLRAAQEWVGAKLKEGERASRGAAPGSKRYGEAR